MWVLPTLHSKQKHDFHNSNLDDFLNDNRFFFFLNFMPTDKWRRWKEEALLYLQFNLKEKKTGTVCHKSIWKDCFIPKIEWYLNNNKYINKWKQWFTSKTCKIKVKHMNSFFFSFLVSMCLLVQCTERV